jgi:hypothetical protein
MNKILSTSSGFKLDRLWFKTHPAFENSRSTLVVVAGIEKIDLAYFDSSGN